MFELLSFYWYLISKDSMTREPKTGVSVLGEVQLGRLF